MTGERGCLSLFAGWTFFLQRIRLAHAAGIPITNYGVAISLTQGVLERALGPFPEALAAFRAALEEERPSRK